MAKLRILKRMLTNAMTKCRWFVGPVCFFLFLTQYHLLELHYRKSAFTTQNPGTPFVSHDLSESELAGVSHALENECKYPVLHPNDKNIEEFVRHSRQVYCKKIQPDYVRQNHKGLLEFPEKDENIKCKYTGLGGGLYPKRTEITKLGGWVDLDMSLPTFLVPYDQYLVECFQHNDPDSPVFSQAFAHIIPRKDVEWRELKEDEVNLNLLVLDSVSLNQFRRHMFQRTLPIMNEMGFEFMEGYNKVGDNSMVNLMPLLAGLRYANQSKDMPSDILPQTYDKTALTTDDFNFIWNQMQDQGCASMYNDDIQNYGRGLFYYPDTKTKGFAIKPTDYYFRPWYVYNYKKKHANATKQCFGNDHIGTLHMSLFRQFVSLYHAHRHFSFNFLVDLSHDDPNVIETLDNTLADTFEELYRGNKLNNTVLVLMGDHGNRIYPIRHSYVGSFEERMPLFSIYIPQWLKVKYPEMNRNLKINTNRLTSNFDAHQTLVDIVHGRWGRNSSLNDGMHGQSLFDPIAKNRTCFEAGIPEQYCICMEPKSRSGMVLKESDDRVKKAKGLLLQYFSDLKNDIRCENLTYMHTYTSFKFTSARSYVMTQMVRHGLRYQGKLDMKKLKTTKAFVEIEYIEIEGFFEPHGLKVLTRFQNENKFFPDRFHLNTEPMVISGQLKQCKSQLSIPDYCLCLSLVEDIDETKGKAVLQS